MLVAHVGDEPDGSRGACQRCGFGGIACGSRLARAAVASAFTAAPIAALAPAFAPLAAFATRRTVLARFRACAVCAVYACLQVCDCALSTDARLAVAAFPRSLAFTSAFAVAATFAALAAVSALLALTALAASLLAVTLAAAFATLLAIAPARTFGGARLAIGGLGADFAFAALLAVAAASVTTASITAFAVAPAPAAAAVAAAFTASVATPFALFLFSRFDHGSRRGHRCRRDAEQPLDPCHETVFGGCRRANRGWRPRYRLPGCNRFGLDRCRLRLRDRRRCIRQHALDHRLLLVAAFVGAASYRGRIFEILGHV
ncbi:MAG TPA: hypothetical protein VN667_06935, partial [Burkholderiales bacterium]|nr:hypothetical protein [Burkholderiales bacterium]